MADSNDQQALRISISRRHRGKVKNESWTWGDFAEHLATAEVSRETLAEYRAMSKEERLALKNVGYFVAGHFRDGVRRTAHLEGRCLVSLDLDDIPQSFYESLLAGRSRLAGYECLIHSTRSHATPDHIRIRLLLPLSKEIPPIQYEPVARMVASWINPEMDLVDRVSFVAAQPMFWPSRCSDGEYVYHRAEGKLLDPDDVLLEYLVWEDPAEWPKREDETLHRNAGDSQRREDPRQRINAPVVAAFCRAYDVHEAIETFLPDVYDDAVGYEGERYTYRLGSSSGGARVYDDGLYLHSEHDTDPAHGQHHAFDLVRIHLYGDLDKDVDFTLTPLASWPSYKAMQELAEGDSRVKAALEEVEQEAFAARCEALNDLFEDLGDEDAAVEEDPFDDIGGFELPKPEKQKPRNADELLAFLSEKMNLAENVAALDKIARKVQDIAMLDFGARYRDRLADVYVKRIKMLSDGRYALTRAEGKKHLRPSEKASREAVKKQGMPAWMENWVYLTGEDKFLNLTSTERISATAFNAKFDARCVEDYPSEETGLPAVHAADAATTLFEVPKPYVVQYWPGRGALYDHQGLEYANTYRDTGCTPDGYTGTRGIKLLKLHVRNILPDPRDQALLLDWLAHIVQNPERKMMYACLLKGVRGDGKTFFIELMRTVLGDANCRDVLSSMLKKEFNGWAADTVFCGIEEVKQHGSDAHDVMNNLKALITNNIIAVERKGQDIISVRNFANFFMTTNYSDALPVTVGENRYLTLATRFRTEAELLEWKAGWKEEHGYDFHEALYEELTDHPYQFRRWLEEYEFSEHYNPNARAPETAFKMEMVEDAKSDERQLLEDVLGREDEPLLTERVFVWWRFKQLLDLANPRNRMTGRAVGAMMNDLGFIRAGKERMEGKQGWVWTRDPKMKGHGSVLSSEGKEALDAAWAAWDEVDDFDTGNVVAFKR